MYPPIVYRFIVIFIASILWTTGCAKNKEEQVTSSSTVQSRASSVSTPVNSRQSDQSFGLFLAEFSNLIDSRNWNGLADITDFPLTIRGELDDEGSVEINREKFIKLIGNFFQEKVYLTLNDELVESTYHDLLNKPIEEPQVHNDHAQLHGFHFIKKNHQWKLKRISTYVHIVERFSHGGK
jgi:hypothetical protein